MDEARTNDEKDIGNLWKYYHSLNTRFTETTARFNMELRGGDGKGGIAGRLDDHHKMISVLQDRQESLEDWGRDVWYNRRPAECIGRRDAQAVAEDLDKLKEELPDMIAEKVEGAILKERIELRKSRTAMWGGVIVSALAAASMLANTLLTHLLTPKP